MPGASISDRAQRDLSEMEDRVDEHIDWRSVFGGITLGLAAMAIGTVVFSRRTTRSRSGRVRHFLIRAGILPKPRHAHVGPIAVPDTVQEIPEVFLRAFR